MSRRIGSAEMYAFLPLIFVYGMRMTMRTDRMKAAEISIYGFNSAVSPHISMDIRNIATTGVGSPLKWSISYPVSQNVPRRTMPVKTSREDAAITISMNGEYACEGGERVE